MRLGVDFGTTRIVAASVDRGNYPVVSFEGPEGERFDWFPPLVAIRGDERRYGWDAWAAQGDGSWTILRSIKRYLEDSGPATIVDIAGSHVRMLTLLVELTGAFRQALTGASSLQMKPDDPIEVMLGVPANANGNQRFLTVEAFRAAGFEVLGLLNEPSAAAVEFTHANRTRREAREGGSLLVYDLGGGTFDASLVRTDGRSHVVVASEGIPTLGGDDFDHILAELALDQAGVDLAERDSVTQSEWFRLLEECRRRKEAVHPNTRRMVIEMETVREGWDAVQVPVSDFFSRCAPLVEETVAAAADLLHQQKTDPDTVYLTGGSSDLPLVPRALKEVYGRRVRRGSYTRSTTAIGLAIQADAQSGYRLQDTFTRNFGVWREADGGSTMVFDPLFEKGTRLPSAGEAPIHVARSYFPVHNIGHFRYLECTHRDDDGRPAGEITVWDEIQFPFDPHLQDTPKLDQVTVGHCDSARSQSIVETYSCDAGGSVTVTVSNRSSDYQRTYRLGRWAAPAAPIKPGARAKRSRARKR